MRPIQLHAFFRICCGMLFSRKKVDITVLVFHKINTILINQSEGYCSLLVFLTVCRELQFSTSISK